MRSKFYLAGVLGLLLLFGCSQDPSAPEGDRAGLVEAKLDTASAGFSLILDTAATPDSLARGPFFLRGENLRYDDTIGALVCELIIRNDGVVSHPDPVSITFRQFIPDDVILLNSPDDSPTLFFEFANDDLWWTPGEESFPLTVMLLVDPGVSVGFVAQISVGGGTASGVIAGRAWLDENLNGVADPDEPGLPDVLFRLDDGGPEEDLVLAQTGPDGRYHFSDLTVGLYEVSVWEAPNLAATTPSARYVLLAPENGGVSRFDGTDFGFIFAPALQGPVLVVEEPNLGRVIGIPGETTVWYEIHPGQELDFSWVGRYVPPRDGPFIIAYRYGWDLADPDDPDDPGWALPPGVSPEHLFAPTQTFAEGIHRLTVQCQDDQEALTRVHVQLEVTDIASGVRDR